MVDEEPKSANFLADERTNLAADRTNMARERTDLAVTRTIMAADRTLMGWIRTGLAILSFGFTIYKFIIYLKESIFQTVIISAQGPRRLGIFLISLGTVSIILGLIEYCLMFRRLGKSCPRKPWTFAFFVGVISSLFGLFLVVTIIIHKEVF